MTRPPSEAADLTHLIPYPPHGPLLARRFVPYHTAEAMLCVTTRLVTRLLQRVQNRKNTR
jgi:hypothetical protein